MKLCRFNDDRLGVVDGDLVRDVTAALEVLPTYRYPLPAYDVLIANLPQVVSRVRAIADDAPTRPLAEVTLLSPIANPGKLIAAPVNFQKHLEEVRSDVAIHNNNPGLTVTIHSAGVFLKATSSLVGAGEGIASRLKEIDEAAVSGHRRPETEDTGFALDDLDVARRGNLTNPEARCTPLALRVHDILAVG